MLRVKYTALRQTVSNSHLRLSQKKKNYRMNVDQFFPKFVAPQKFS